MPITGVELRMSARFRLAATVGTMLSLASPAAADCNIPSGQKALERSDVVFRGVVRDVDHIAVRQRATGPGWGSVVRFAVSRVWKGDLGTTFVLHNRAESAEDIPFEAGREYLVFAVLNEPSTSALFGLKLPSFAARGCGGTQDILWASPSLIDLGAGRPPAVVRRLPDPRTLQ